MEQRNLFKCLLAVAVLGSLGLVSGKLEALPAGWMEKDPRVKHIQGTTHATVEEIMKELKQEQASQSDGPMRYKRQSGSPVTEGRHEFEDGYQYGRVHYSGQQSDVIFVMTYDLSPGGIPTHTNLYKSVDYGSTFTNIESRLDASDSDPLLWTNFYVSSFNKNMLVFPHATNAKFYYTLNEGVTWTTQEFTPNTINPRSLLWNPTEDNWIVAHDSTNDHLYVTQHLGQTWIKIADYVDSPSDYQWGDPNVDTDLSIVFFNTYDPDDRNRGNFTVDLYIQKNPYTDDTRREFDPNLGRHDNFQVVGPYIFAQKTESESGISLLVSYNREPFNKAMIPSTSPHVDYRVSHINSLQALVIGQHTSGEYNLYLSDITGVYFSLSLPDIVLKRVLDLEVIEGVNGTMIANQYVREDPSESNPPVRTLITLDNGGTWELLRAPPEDAAGNPCEPPLCSLHFHMDTSQYARLGVYSEASAPGIIVAHGNTGTELSEYPDLYISRDDGISWEKTLDGSWGVSVLDHGGLMVAAMDYHHVPSNEIMYTCDEGISWQSFIFEGSTMYVFGVITEPGEHTTVVSLYGIESFQTPFHWEVVTVNFTDIFPRMCNDSDYYDWMPWDERLDGEDCILGSSITIERREVEVCCLNGREYVREFDFQICHCAAEDFECDYGYERADGFTGPCVRDPTIVLPDPCANSSVSTYSQTRGYRKVAGDVCEGGDESLFLPYSATCCQSGPDVDCGSLSSPTHGHVDFSTTNFGSVASYNCDNGYCLSGQSMTICQADGTWSGSTPTCEIVDCGQLDDITSGQVTLSITTYGSSGTYSCDSGYTLNGPNSRICQADGYWSGSDPSCDLVDCGLVTAPTNGVVILSSTRYLSVASYRCSTGYQLSGQNTQTCQADGTWSGNKPTCDIVDCSTPTAPTNGQASFVSINFTSVVAYSCDSDYTLSGPNSRFCQADGTWSGSKPSCDLVGCGLVVAPTNGVVTLSSTTYLSVATYGCITGYQLSGQNTQTCQADGTWSGNKPTCDIVDCRTPTTPTNGQVTYILTTFTSIATYSCGNGYELNGTSATICRANGFWSESVPTCDKLSSTSTGASSDSGDVGGIVVGVILLVAIIAVVVLLLVIVIFVCKYYLLRKRYIHVATSPQEQQYSFRNLSHSDEAVIPLTATIQDADDSDDEPIVP